MELDEIKLVFEEVFNRIIVEEEEEMEMIVWELKQEALESNSQNKRIEEIMPRFVWFYFMNKLGHEIKDIQVYMHLLHENEGYEFKEVFSRQLAPIYLNVLLEYSDKMMELMSKYLISQNKSLDLELFKENLKLYK